MPPVFAYADTVDTAGSSTNVVHLGCSAGFIVC